PTVWSNCLAGWLLGEAGDLPRLGVVLLGTSFLYAGGMFLNDAFDAEFDQQFRMERPIPSGAIRRKIVSWLGFAWLGIGYLIVALLGPQPALWGLALVGFILLYDAVHKKTAIAPLLMGTCRFLLYVIAASASTKGVSGLAIYDGLALGVYVIGLTYVAR